MALQVIFSEFKIKIKRRFLLTKYYQYIVFVYFLCFRILVRRFNYTFSFYDLKESQTAWDYCPAYKLLQPKFAITCL